MSPAVPGSPQTAVGNNMCLPCGRYISRLGSRTSIFHLQLILLKPAYSRVRPPSLPTSLRLSFVVLPRVSILSLSLKCGTKTGTFFYFLPARVFQSKSSRLNAMSLGISVSRLTFSDSIVAWSTNNLVHRISISAQLNLHWCSVRIR